MKAASCRAHASLGPLSFAAPDEEEAIASRPMTPGQTGESGGGPYPNPRDNSDPDAHDFQGSQSDQAYYGKGDDFEPGKNENATSDEHEPR